MIERLLRKNFNSDEEFEEFATWAFGVEWDSLNSSTQMISAWNENHYWQYNCNLLNTLNRDVEFMLKLWEEKKSRQSSRLKTNVFKEFSYDNAHYITDDEESQ